MYSVIWKRSFIIFMQKRSSRLGFFWFFFNLNNNNEGWKLLIFWLLLLIIVMGIIMINLGRSDDNKNNYNEDHKDENCKTFNQASCDIEEKLARHTVVCSHSPLHTQITSYWISNVSYEHTLATVSETLRILAVFLWRRVNKENFCFVFCCSYRYDVRIFFVFPTKCEWGLRKMKFQPRISPLMESLIIEV